MYREGEQGRGDHSRCGVDDGWAALPGCVCAGVCVCDVRVLVYVSVSKGVISPRANKAAGVPIATSLDHHICRGTRNDTK